MNRKDGGKEGRTREGALSWSPEAGARKKTSGNGGREEAGKAGGKEERGEGRRRFSEFFGVKREKKRDNCLISNKNH